MNVVAALVVSLQLICASGFELKNVQLHLVDPNTAVMQYCINQTSEMSSIMYQLFVQNWFDNSDTFPEFLFQPLNSGGCDNITLLWSNLTVGSSHVNLSASITNSHSTTNLKQEPKRSESLAYVYGFVVGVVYIVVASFLSAYWWIPTFSHLLRRKCHKTPKVSLNGLATCSTSSNGVTKSLLISVVHNDFDADEFIFFPQAYACDLQFSDISFDTTCERNGIFHILKNLRGRFKHGQITAILGPSGAGKSTLLNVLSGRSKCNTGKINFTTQNLDSYKPGQLSNYVMQDCRLHEQLTIEESLMYSAQLKLPDTMELSKKRKLVSRLMTVFNLKSSSQTRVADLSGGERKRLSIALELVIIPPVLFLDEPTSGLDYQSSFNCISFLKYLTTKGTNVICSIHQPSARIFQLFDEAYVMTNGHSIYCGPIDNVESYFKLNGIFNLNNQSTPDFVIEICAGIYGDQTQTLQQKALEHVKLLDCTSANKHPPMFFQSGNFYSHYKWLFRRKFVCAIRDSNLTKLRLLAHLLVGTFVGFLYFDMGNSAENTTNNTGCLYFSCLFLTFTAIMPTIMTFPIEKDTAQYERFNHWYSISEYYWAITTLDIPFQVVFSFLFSLVIYLLTGQPMEICRFLMFLLIATLTALTAQSLGLLIGSGCSLQTAIYMGPVTAVPTLLFSGYMMKFDSMLLIWRFMSYLSYVRYSFEGVLIVIFGSNRAPFDCDATKDCLGTLTPKNLLDVLNIKEDRLAIDILSLTAFIVVFRLMSFVLLYLKRK